jgi:hypothetical protein
MTELELPLARPHARASAAPSKPALDYLRASGAAPIFIVAIGDAGTKVDPNARAIFWIAEVDAKTVVKAARSLASKNQNTDAAIETLKKAAVECRAVLTDDDVAMQRAANAAGKLDAYIDSLRGTGVLNEFTKAYRRRRIAAAERGQGYMTFRQAELRFKLALIPLLMNGGKPAIGSSLFAAIFDA